MCFSLNMRSLVFHWFLCCNLTFFYISIFNVWLRYDKWHCELPPNYIFCLFYHRNPSRTRHLRTFDRLRYKTGTSYWLIIHHYYVLNNIFRIRSDIHKIHILSSTTWLSSLCYNHQEFYKKWYLDHVLKSYLQQVSDFMRNG